MDTARDRAVRSRAAGAGGDGSSRHCDGLRRRRHAGGRPYFVDGVRPGEPITAYAIAIGCPRGSGSSCFCRSATACTTRTRKAIIHRDLKPPNILVTLPTATLPKIIDFGVAKACSSRSWISRCTPSRHAHRHARVHEPRTGRDDGG